MALLGQLDPRQQQAEQQRTRTVQSLAAEQELQKLLQGHGQNASGQAFTSPWQVAGQWANALAGRSKANDLAGGYASMNALAAPGSGAADASSMPAQAPAQPSPGASAAPSASGGSYTAKPASPEIKQAILEAAQATGVDPQMLAGFASIESHGNPNAETGSYKGLMQLSEAEMRRVSNGQGNVWNPKDSAMAAGLIAKENQPVFEKFTGRPASHFDLYMMHQQGRAGYLQHLGNPDELAWKNMAATGEGQQKGPRWAQAAITGNLGHINDTSRQFLQRWQDRFDRHAAGDHSALEGAKVLAGGAAPSPSAPASQGQGAGAPNSPVQQGQFIPGQLPARPQFGFDLPRIQALARSGQINAQQAQEMYRQLQESQQPQSMDYMGGKVMYGANGQGQQTFIPGLQNKPIKLPGGLETQMPYYVNPQGQAVYGEGQPGQGGGGSIASQPAPGGLGAALRSGDIDRMNQAGIQSAADLEGAKKGSEQAATSMAAVVRGARGLGTTGAKIESLANDMHEVVSDPKWSQGGGMAGTRQALSRLTSSLGLDPDAATPRGVIEQASKILKLYQMEALKTGTSELGENAGRVFQTEAETLGEIAPTGEETQQEMLAKLKTLSRLGGHWRELGDVVDEHVAKNNGKPTNGVFKLLREHESGFHLLPGMGRESTGAVPRRGSADMPLPPMPGGTTPNGVKWKLVQ